MSVGVRNRSASIAVTIVMPPRMPKLRVNMKFEVTIDEKPATRSAVPKIIARPVLMSTRCIVFTPSPSLTISSR